jgi:hypothetical protein
MLRNVSKSYATKVRQFWNWGNGSMLCSFSAYKIPVSLGVFVLPLTSVPIQQWRHRNTLPFGKCRIVDHALLLSRLIRALGNNTKTIVNKRVHAPACPAILCNESSPVLELGRSASSRFLSKMFSTLAQCSS